MGIWYSGTVAGPGMETPSPDYEQLVRLWLDLASQMASAGSAVSTESPPGNAAKQMRNMYFQTLSQHTEQFMRSPQFLEMVKQSTDFAVTLRQQANDFLAQSHHALGGPGPAGCRPLADGHPPL